jgi:hypothetical protein
MLLNRLSGFLVDGYFDEEARLCFGRRICDCMHAITNLVPSGRPVAATSLFFTGLGLGDRPVQSSECMHFESTSF